MDLAALKTFFETSPAISLFRAQNACYIVDFLSRIFKQAESQIVISHSDLLSYLTHYCEDIHEVEPDSFIGKPEDYIAQWSSPEHRWIDRKLSTSGPPEYQLTRHAETVLSFLNQNLNNELGYIGTESRLRLIIRTLGDLVEKASDDPEVRLKSLRQKKSELISEIARLERDDSEVQMSDVQIREQFIFAISLLQNLQSDFRAVEEEFKKITMDVQAKQAEALQTRGEILGGVLDAEDVLRTNDQGVSFYEFFRFILSPTQQASLQETIEELKEITALKAQTKSMDTLSQMIYILVQEAQKIMGTNQRLTMALRRLLDLKQTQQRVRISDLLREIQASAMELSALRADDGFPEVPGMSLELKAALESPWKYSFWSPTEDFEVPDISTFQADSEKHKAAFNMLAQMKRINWDRLKSNIHEITQRYETVTLKELISQFPLKSGPIEVLCYLQLASEQSHIVSKEAKEEIRILNDDSEDSGIMLTVPLVRFIKKFEEI